MSNPFSKLDKVLEHSVRLQILSILVVNESFDFNSLKETLELSDGNLATHIKALEREKYILINKSFVGKKPNTRYRLSEKGRQAFKKHIDALEAIIKTQKQ
ncbi:MAG TPA: transcriptional regulator [Cyclobacteriaceae bacterium]|nr:transcriptional regulator [Cyclobacteriaceae bacterium]HRK52969.1 transcriptional regulator [Cyclobacteriaceae bacterium]